MQHRVFATTLRNARRALSRTSGTGHFRWRLAASCAALGVLGGFGCSLLYDLNTDQCSADGDCTSQFGSGYTCSAVHVCQAPLQTGGGGGQGGSITTPSGGSAGDGSGGSSGSDSAGSSGAGSSGGPTVECTTNSECIDSHGEQPFVCREGSCVDLLSNECPFVINLDNLRSENPIILGGFTFIPDESLTDSPVTANYELALDEFTTQAPGGGLQNGRRKIAIVACDGVTTAKLAPGLNHLIDVVQVPAVLAAVVAPELVTLFESKGRQAGVFFLSPIDADSSLTRLQDDGLVWNILGSYGQLAQSYVPLVARTEAYLRTKQTSCPGDPLPCTRAFKVAVVDDDTTAQQDISAELIGTNNPLFINGKSVIDPTNDTCGPGQDEPCFLSRTIPADETGADYTPFIDALNTFQPDIIVSPTGEAFVDNVLESLETVWSPASPRKPFYLMGPNHAALPALGAAIIGSPMSGRNAQCDGSPCPLNGRILGINFESARNPAVLNSYRTRFAGKYPLQSINFENFYDATWYMIYAIAAAGDVPLTGDAIARGMSRVIKNQPDRIFDVGPSAVNDALYSLTQLTSANGIQVNGAMGPPDFDPSSGSRKTLGSAYCLQFNGGFVFDALRYIDTSGPSMEVEPGPPPCVPANF